MRLVATSDTHHPVDVNFIPDGDVFVHVGDLMTTGYPDDFQKCIQWLGKLPHTLKYFICGNHDNHMEKYPGPALQELRKLGVTVIGLPGNDNYLSVTLPNGMKMLGLPYVTGLMRWAFDTTEEFLEYKLNELSLYNDYDIIASHCPPYGLLDKITSGHNIGIKAYRNYLDHNSVGKNTKLWLTGHMHESYGYIKYNNTDVYNVAMCDRSHRHVNPPIVLDL